MSSSGFDIWVMLASYRVRKFSLCFYFLEEVAEKWYWKWFSLNVCWNSAGKPSGPGAFFFRGLLIIDLISLVAVSLFRRSISLWVLVVCVLQGIGAFHLLQSCRNRMVYDIYFIKLLVSRWSVVMTPLSYLMLVICVSGFFLDCIARSLSLVLFFQIASFWFYWFFSFHFLFSVWLIFAFLLFIFSVCFILNCSSFSSFLKWKFRWLILDLSSLLICCIQCYIFNALVWLHHTNFGFLFSLSFSSL